MTSEPARAVPASFLPAGSTIGILGGGQLGRLLALAAAKLGMRTHIYCPDPDSPAFEVTPNKTIAAYDDKKALTAFARSVDIVTYEFENVPAATATLIADLVPLAPDARALAISQDRLQEKAFLQNARVAICPFAPVLNATDLKGAIKSIGLPAVLKTTRLGYDGKGQRIVKTREQAQHAFNELSRVPGEKPQMVLEAFVPFEKEISVIVARNHKEEIAVYDPAENIHLNHILHTSTLPARITPQTAHEATEIATRIAKSLNYCGVLGVEFFVSKRGQTQQLLVNEIAPRVHNSGHWTESVCPTSQFEQHIRAICNWPLGSTRRYADVVMENLVGETISTVPGSLSQNEQPNVYGKSKIRAGRKMGHINRILPPSG